MKNVDIYGEQFVHVNWEDTESLVEPHICSNVVVASFVTAQARLKLYESLDKLNERVLYFDTDSIIYEHKIELWNQTIGDRPGFNCWFSSAPVFQWCCSTPQGSPGVGHNTFLSSPHLCFIIVFICDLFVSRDDPLMS